MNAYPHELSGGMAQRVVIAMALICNPAFIISDDATSGLDVTVQAQILSLLGRLAADHGSAMLFITRDVGITAHFCDRVAVLYAGEIMELAPREDLFLQAGPSLHADAAGRLLAQPGAARSLERAGYGPAHRSASRAASTPAAARSPSRCAAEHPPLFELRSGQAISRCHFPVRHE